MTTATKAVHTPGPWHLTQSGKFVRYTQSDGTTPNICDLDCFGGPLEEHRGNAILIAVAPELLKSLADLYETARNILPLIPDRNDAKDYAATNDGRCGQTHVDALRFREYFAEAGRVLAKAKGGAA